MVGFLPLLPLLAAALLFAPPVPDITVREPPPPLGTPQIFPVWRITETSYRCGAEEAVFRVRYDDASRAEFVSAQRRGRAVSAADLGKVTEGLRRLETVTSIRPECADTVHILTASGAMQGRPALVLIIWTPHAITATDPLYEEDYPGPGQRR